VPTSGPTGEEWRPVADFTGYEVSSFGRVRSCARSVPRGTRWGVMTVQKVPERILKQSEMKVKNRIVSLKVIIRRNDRVKYNCRVHHLVLKAFVGPRPVGMEGCHNNGNPTDNTVNNLRWDTRKNNATDAIRHGTACFPRLAGEKHGRAKLTAKQVKEIKYLYDPNMRNGASLARRMGVSESAIRHIAHGRNWRTLAKDRLSSLNLDHEITNESY
jgi:hypothetical protein